MKALLTSACMMVLGAAAQASTLNLTFTGEGIGINAGSEVVVDLAIDTTTAPFSAFGGTFYNSAYTGTINVTGGDYDGGSGSFDSTANRLLVDDAGSSFGDRILFEQFASPTNFNVRFQLDLIDSTETAISDEAIPSVWDLSAYDQARISFAPAALLGLTLNPSNRNPIYEITNISVRSTGVAPVPLPASLPLRVVSIAGFGIVRRRRSKS